MATKIEQYRDWLLAMLPPGAYNISPGGVIYSWAEALASLLANTEETTDSLELQTTPHRATECLDEWESLLDSPNATGATNKERQDALVSRWRLAIGVRLFGIRSVLAPLLNPEYNFKDECDAGDVSWRYTIIPGGTGADDEDTTRLRVAITAGDSRWNSLVKLQHLLLLPLIDKTDSYEIQVQLLGDGLNNDTHCGIVLYSDEENAWLWGPYQDGAGVRTLAVTRLINNDLQVAVHTVAIPAYPYWISASRDIESDTFSFKYGPNLGAMTTLITLPNPSFKRPVRYAGIFARNGVGLNAAHIDIDDIYKQYDKQENNVEIIETPLKLIVAGQETQKFFFFVHRDPTDAGTYNLDEAQLMLDRAKSGHTLGIIGESDAARWDDPYSLYDRDIWSL